MSIRAIRWAWRARAATAKLVLLALADTADESGYCFPSHAHLAHKCELSESTVRRMLNVLASRKLLRIEPRFNQNGSCTSNGYRLTIDDHPVNLEGRVVNLTERVSNDEQGTCSSVTPPLFNGDQVTTTEPYSYPVTTTPATCIVSPKPLNGSGCDRGGELCFPRTVSESQRRTLEEHLGVLSHDQAQQVLDELAGRLASKRVRNLVSYCAALVRSVERGKFKPELASQIADRRKAEQQRHARLQSSPPSVSKTSPTLTDRMPDSLRASIERMRAKSIDRPANISAEEGSSEG